MSILKKIATVFRGKANEAGEAFVDANIQTTLDQEIRDEANRIQKFKGEIAKVGGSVRGLEREVKELTGKKEQAIAAMKSKHTNGDKEGAQKLMEYVQEELNPELTPKEEQLASMSETLEKLKRNLKASERNHKAAERRVSIEKAKLVSNKLTEEAVASAVSHNSKSSTINSTLDRLEAKNTQKSDTLAALEEMEQESKGTNLDDLLKEDTSNLSFEEQMAKL